MRAIIAEFCSKRFLMAACGTFLFSAVLPVQQASALEVYDVGAFMHSSSLGPDSLGYLDGVFDDFAGSGIDMSFSRDLSSDGYGTFTWNFVNNSGLALADVWLFGFLDAEIDPDLNSSYNEYGRLYGVHGTGAGDTAADSWEIDEPGFSTGDIFNNLIAGALDNQNTVPAGSENDVSLGLGFYLGDLLAGDRWTLTLQTSLDNIGGLIHGDSDSLSEFFFNGVAVVERDVTPVPEPSAFLLMLLGLCGLAWQRSQSQD